MTVWMQMIVCASNAAIGVQVLYARLFMPRTVPIRLPYEHIPEQHWFEGRYQKCRFCGRVMSDVMIEPAPRLCQRPITYPGAIF